MAFAAEGNEIAVIVGPAIANGSDVMYVESYAGDGVELPGWRAALDAALVIQLMDPSAALAADPRGVIAPAPFVVRVLRPHGPGDLGATVVEAAPTAPQRTRSHPDCLPAQIACSLDECLWHMGIDADPVSANV